MGIEVGKYGQYSRLVTEHTERQIEFAVRACLHRKRDFTITQGQVMRSYGRSEQVQFLIKKYFDLGLEYDFFRNRQTA